MPSKKMKFSLKQSESLVWDLDTDDGPVTLTATVRSARVLEEWKRREYHDQLEKRFPVLDNPEEWDSLPAAERLRRNQHFSMMAVLYAVVELTVAPEGEKPQPYELTFESLEELPSMILNEMYITAIRMNPQWAPLAPAANDEDSDEGEDDPNG